jgi:hypothetical protein
MATFNSLEYGYEVAVPPTQLNPGQKHGRVRIAHFGFSAAGGNALTASAGDTLNLVKLPAGKVRVMSIVHKKTAFGTSGTMALGHGGYSPLTGAAVAASTAAFVAAQAMDNTNTVRNEVDVEIESKSGFIVTGTLAVAAATAEDLVGWVEYVCD